MKLNMVILIIVVGLSSCAELNPQPTESDVGLRKLKCQGMSNPQRNDCLNDIPPAYNKYQEDRQKLLKDRAN